jgi:integrase
MIRTNHTLAKDDRTGIYYTRFTEGEVTKRVAFGKDEDKAQKKLQRLEEDLAAGEITLFDLKHPRPTRSLRRGDIRLETLIYQYLENIKPDLAPSTYNTRKRYLKRFLAFTGPCMVSQLTPVLLLQYRVDVRKHDGRRLKRKKPSSKPVNNPGGNAGNTHLRHVKTLLRWGEEKDICVSPIRRFPTIRERNPVIREFSQQDIQKLLLRMPDGDLKDLVLFAILTGLRPQELRLLAQDNIRRTEDGRLSVMFEHHKTSDMSKVPCPRVVPLSQTAIEIIQKRMQSHPKSATIFVNEEGEPYKAATLRQRLERWCMRAGIGKRTPYALRHFFGTTQAGLHTNQTVLAQVMGHTQIRTTAKYIGEVQEYQQDAMDSQDKKVISLLQKDNAKPSADVSSCCILVTSSEEEKKDAKRQSA